MVHISRRSLESVLSAEGAREGPILVYTQHDNHTLRLLRQLNVSSESLFILKFSLFLRQ